jgi:flagellar FliL protein
MVHFDAFVVNLADTGGARYLRLTLALVVEGEQTAIALTDEGVLRMRVRSSILELLAQETGARLVTTEGKAALKLAIAERASQAAEGLKVSDVLFSEFIVQ